VTGAARAGWHVLVADLLVYLRAMEVELIKNPLLDRFGLKLDSLRMPLHVVSYKPFRDIEIHEREHFRKTEYCEDLDDEQASSIWALRGAQFENRDEIDSRPEPLSELEPKLETAVLLGDPGSGKTEWLKYFSRVAAKESIEKLEEGKNSQVSLKELVFPAYLRLSDISEALEAESELQSFLLETKCVKLRPDVLSDAERLAAAVLKALIEHHQLSRLLAPVVWRRLNMKNDGGKKIKCVFYLDALDEVCQGQEKLARCLNAFAFGRSARIFLTSRIMGYQRLLSVDSSRYGPRRELQICPFEPKESKTFVENFFRDYHKCCRQILKEFQNKNLFAGMARNPLLATLLCMAFYTHRGCKPLDVPVRRVEIYKRVLHGVLGEWEAIRNGKRPDVELINVKIELLEEIAYHFFPAERLDGERLTNFLRNGRTGYITKLDASHPLKRLINRVSTDSIIDELSRKDGVIVPLGGVDANDFTFLHIAFQEFLAAQALAKRRDWLKIALSHVYDNKWEEVLTMMGGLLAERTPRYIATLLRKNHEDILLRPFRLAVKVTVEAESIYLSQVYLNRIRGMTVELWLGNSPLTYGFSGILNEFMPLVVVWNESILPHLIKLLPENIFVRRAVVNAMAMIGSDKTIPLLIRLLDDIYVRFYAIAALARIDSEQAVLPLIKLLDHNDWDVKISAIEALGATGSEQAFLHLINLFDSGYLRSFAVEALGRGGYHQAVPDLIKLLKDQDKVVQKIAVKAIGGAGSAKDISLLTKLLNDKELRLASVKALGMMGFKEAGPILIKLLDDKDICWSAVEALGRIGYEEAGPILTKLLDDKKVRSSAAKALGRIGYMEAGPILIMLLDNKDICWSAVEALGMIGYKDAVPILTTLLDSKYECGQLIAVEALGRIGDDKAVPHLTNLLDQNNWNWNAKLYAARALGEIGSKQALNALTSRLKHDTIVRDLTRILFSVRTRLMRPIPLSCLSQAMRAKMQRFMVSLEELVKMCDSCRAFPKNSASGMQQKTES